MWLSCSSGFSTTTIMIVVVKVSNKVLEVSEATIAKWNDIDGGEVGADL